MASKALSASPVSDDSDVANHSPLDRLMPTLPMPCRERGIQSSDAIGPGDAHVNALKRPPSTSRYRPLDPYKHAGRTPERVPVENMQQMQYAAVPADRRAWAQQHRQEICAGVARR